ncbi:unnamed protein product [Vitrella brassicaformis CCMP3155]|uniref:Thioredoxin domain-containing protein n=1 Tax=Vitrella brassicaformis (strain CCMP3155) TaxID=1169540 RepID=A0A0G4ED12_VITBC|nr:unnamed protein product [Vitrella brassicaformis CCMP3155]|eukprot:CEL93450.1 unnamed protein product [Vitrella brassicaformis CCMP3155]
MTVLRCGHCKALAPTWEKLAEQIHKKYKTVVIAKLDATANDTGDDVKGFPTLYFYPAGKNKMRRRIAYNGGRELEALLDFVEDNAESIEEDREEKDEL